MDRFFALRYPGEPFDLFGPGHLLAVLLAALVGFFVLRAGLAADEDRRRTIRILFASLLFVNEVGRHSWSLAHGIWSVQTDLPLQMCSAMAWVMPIALLLHARRAWPVLYFFGVAGAMQGIITPAALGYGLPHYIAVETIFAHAMLVTGGLWVVLVEGYRPTLRHAVLAFGALNLAALVMYFVNLGLGSNYLYVNAKPPDASLVDLLPAWPWYILWLEGIAVALFLALYAPFARRRDRSRGTAPQDVEHLVGSTSGPADLSGNPDYLDGLGSDR